MISRPVCTCTTHPEAKLLDLNTRRTRAHDANLLVVHRSLDYIRMYSTVLLAPLGVTVGCHNSNSQSAGGYHTCAILDGGGVK